MKYDYERKSPRLLVLQYEYLVPSLGARAGSATCEILMQKQALRFPQRNPARAEPEPRLGNKTQPSVCPGGCPTARPRGRRARLFRIRFP